MKKAMHCKLVNGDELVVRYVGETDTHYIVNYPMQVSERVTQSGLPIVVLTKYVSLVDSEDIQLAKQHVIVMAPMVREYEYFYEVSKLYNKKFIERGVLNEVENVTKAMERVLDENTNTVALTPPKPSSNQTIH